MEFLKRPPFDNWLYKLSADYGFSTFWLLLVFATAIELAVSLLAKDRMRGRLIRLVGYPIAAALLIFANYAFYVIRK